MQCAHFFEDYFDLANLILYLPVGISPVHFPRRWLYSSHRAPCRRTHCPPECFESVKISGGYFPWVQKVQRFAASKKFLLTSQTLNKFSEPVCRRTAIYAEKIWGRGYSIWASRFILNGEEGALWRKNRILWIHQAVFPELAISVVKFTRHLQSRTILKELAFVVKNYHAVDGWHLKFPLRGIFT